jgi:hypothetical protein
MPISKKRRSQLKDIAVRITQGRILTSSMVPENLIHMVFMPLIFMKKTELGKLAKQSAILFADYEKDAGSGRTINGFPIFFKFNILTQEEHIIVVRYVKAIGAAVEKIR